MIALGLGLSSSNWGELGGVIHGLKLVALAVVAQAIWGMAQSLCLDSERFSLMIASSFVLLWLPGAWSQLGVLALAAVLGWWGLVGKGTCDDKVVINGGRIGKGKVLAGVFLFLFFLLLFILPVFSNYFGLESLAVFDAFYRSGSLVFGGGHVVLPLLEAEVVQSSWVNKDAFLAGYGAAQALPGPLFTFAAFLGTVSGIGPGGIAGGVLCLLAIFLPGFLLVLGVLPYWETLRRQERAQNILLAVNAAVVGLLLAAFFTPLWVSTINDAKDFALGLLAFTALVVWRVPPWLVVIVFAGGSYLA